MTGSSLHLTGGLRLARRHLLSRRAPAALAGIAGCAVALWIALMTGDWDAYGALQLPLVFETACAAIIAVTTASPFGEPERVAGRWLPVLRLGAALGLTTFAACALAAAGIGPQLAGGPFGVLRNLVGLTGIGLLCATVLGGALGWTGPATYMMISVYALYTQWHPPALTTPWLWPARPTTDVGGAVCAGLVFTAGMLAITLRGARDPADG
jgi:hypothetical protein